jgi:hypothetical protein
MSRILKLPLVKPLSTSRRHGLRNLSPDLISEAREDTATQVTRIGLTFLSTATFCLLSLLAPDSDLLGSSKNINVPFAGPVSFFGFMLLGPAILIILRLYLQIYAEHSDRLDQLARSVSVTRAPTLVPLQNPLIRLFSGLVFYVLLPATVALFAWKAAVFPAWGSGLFVVAVAVIVSHVMLPFGRLSWRLKGFLSISAAATAAGIIIAAGIILGFGILHRQFDLNRANLSGRWLAGEDLSKADLSLANLSDANLNEANLSGADLSCASLSNAKLGFAKLTEATLSGADLSGADLLVAQLPHARLLNTNLSGADLTMTNLNGANLGGVDLRGANLTGADLTGAGLNLANLSNATLLDTKLTQPQLVGACGNANTKLPSSLTITACRADWDSMHQAFTQTVCDRAGSGS